MLQWDKIAVFSISAYSDNNDQYPIKACNANKKEERKKKGEKIVGMNSFRNFKNTCILSLKKGDKTVGVMGTIILLIS